jgi:hypothetical protein
MLQIQRITTKWTKLSRGGDGAVRRNATPDGLPIPPISDSSADYILHDNRFLEWEEFDHNSTLTVLNIEPHILLEPLILHITSDYVATRFIWSWNHCGAPERDSHDSFQLSLGQWGRFTCNGRFGHESSFGREWIYHKTVFNVAFVRDFRSDLFLQSIPNANDSRLAVLK